MTTEQVIIKFLDELKTMLDDESMIDEERRLGAALYDIFSNYTNIFQETTNNNKFNKNIILFELREMTNLSTKEIRVSIKKYKKIYTKIINEIYK